MSIKPAPEDILARTIKVVAEQLGLEESDITPESVVREFDEKDPKSEQPSLGADSLDVVETVMALEDEFNIEIPDEDCEAAHTVQDFVDIIARRV